MRFSGIQRLRKRIKFNICITTVFLVIWIATFLIIWSAWPTNGMDKNNISVRKFFERVGKEDDLTLVTWAHAVNSHDKLTAALANSSVMMLEADILMGRKEDGTNKVPIMAHPPATSSDLTFKEFLTEVKETNKKGIKKGIKLDFKDINAVKPVLEALKKKELRFPVWINADIFKGPVNSTKTPLDANKFLSLAKEYNSTYSTLSIGWTTRFGMDDVKDSEGFSPPKPITAGQYTREHFEEALAILKANDIDALTEITFPLRAALAVHSKDAIMNVLFGIRGRPTTTTITLWSPVGEDIDSVDLERLVDQVQKPNIYMDLPSSSPKSSDSTTVVSVDDHEPESDPKDDASVSGSVALLSTFTSILATIIFSVLVKF